ANKPILAALELPATLMVTPRAEAGSDRAFIRRFAHALQERRPGGAIVRVEHADGRGHGPLLRELVACAEGEGSLLFLDAGGVCDLPPGFSGSHLPAAVLNQLDARPERAGYVGASVHTEAEARKAGELGLDYVIAGSVRETPSHPGCELL